MKLDTKLIAMAAILLSGSAWAWNDVADNVRYKPEVMLSGDYFDSDPELWGVSLHVMHHDPHYPDWGYYLGYAWGSTDSMPVPEPNEHKIEHNQWRFGLSYSVMNNLSLTGGIAYYRQKSSFTNNVMPLSVEGEPHWQTERSHKWRPELGANFRFANMMLGAGYQFGADAYYISLGFR